MKTKEYESTICNGCFCSALAKASGTDLNLVCHGKPTSYYKDMLTVCPCSDCLVKMVCQDPCKKYKSYKKGEKFKWL